MQSALELANIRDEHPKGRGRRPGGDNLVLHERRFRAGTNDSRDFRSIGRAGRRSVLRRASCKTRTLIRATRPGAQQFLVGKEKKLERFVLMACGMPILRSLRRCTNT